MSDGENVPGDGAGGNAGYTPPATQEDLNSIIASRVDRVNAKFADYDELKAAASKLAEIEAANLTELEKAQADAEAARAETVALKASLAERDAQAALSALVAEVAAAKGVPADLLHGGTREELEAHAAKLAAFGGAPKVNVVPTAGSGGENTSGGGLAAGRERARKK